MKVGTKSGISGCTQFSYTRSLLPWHGGKLFGFPWDPKLWVAFFVHDLGYLAKPNVEHLVLGGRIMGSLFGPEWQGFVDAIRGDFELSLLKSPDPYIWLEGLKLYTRRWVDQYRHDVRNGRTVLRSRGLQDEVFETRS
jgi:hypothetical protein